MALAVAAGALLGVPLRPFWHGSFGLAAALLMPFTLANSSFLFGTEPSRVDLTIPHATFDAGKDRVADALKGWARERGYELLGGAEYVVEPVPGPGDLGRAVVYHLRQASAFDRSRFSWGRSRRRTPDLAVLLLSCNNPVRTALVVVPVTTAPADAAVAGYAGREVAVSLGDELRRAMRNPPPPG